MKIKNLKKRKFFLYILLFFLSSCLLFFMKKSRDENIYSEIYFYSDVDDKNIREYIDAKKDFVVLIHGIASGSWYMKQLGYFLAEQGYIVINIDYPSRSIDIENLTSSIYNEIIKQIETIEKEASSKTCKKQVHFVGHSMGAILIRSILKKYDFTNLGKVVQLAPPNKGSEIADYFYDFPVYEFFYGPAGKELSTKEVATFLDIVDYELGVIAGSRTLAPFSSFFLLEGVDDGRVRVESTKLVGMKEHIVLPVSHTSIGFDREVMENSLHFIKHGTFIRK